MNDEAPIPQPRPDDFRITGDVAWDDVDLDPSILRLRLEYSLQHDRDVWRPTREYLRLSNTYRAEIVDGQADRSGVRCETGVVGLAADSVRGASRRGGQLR